MNDIFKIGEVALIVEGPYKGSECTIIGSPRPVYGLSEEGEKLSGQLFYVIDIHGFPARPGCNHFGRPPGIVKRKPPMERESLGEWELVPYARQIMKPKTVAVGVTMCVLALLSACGSRSIPVKPEDAGIISEQYKIQGYVIRVIRLKDGTRCAYMNNGGMDCDWISQNPRQVEYGR